MLGTTTPSIAEADDAADAKGLFAQGRDLRSHGDCAGALPLFQKAYALYPAGLGSLRNVAVCEEILGHFASSRRSWLKLKRMLATTDDRKYVGWQQDTENAVARLAPKVAWLTADVAIVGGEPVSGVSVRVTVDDQPVDAASLGGPLDQDPGTHVVRATAGDASEPDQQTVDLAAGQTKRVSLRVTVRAASAPAAVAVVPIPATPPPAPPRADPMALDSSGSPRRTAAWISIGLGAAGLAAAGVSLAVRQSALGDVERRCPQYLSAPCDASAGSELESDVDRGRTASTLVNVFGAIGAIGVLAGVVLVATSHPRRTNATLVLSPREVSAVGAF